MPFDFHRFVQKAFASVGPNNPLKKLNDADRAFLMALLTVTDRAQDSRFEDLEQVSAVAAEAGTLGKKIKARMLEANTALGLIEMFPWISILPPMLERFSIQVRWLTENTAGKQGHKGRTFQAQLLVTASEFVKCKTGRYLDEHLAELFQAVRETEDLDEDLSGDAIRKKREHLKKTYPIIYREAVKRARDYSSRRATTIQRKYGIGGDAVP